MSEFEGFDFWEPMAKDVGRGDVVTVRYAELKQAADEIERLREKDRRWQEALDLEKSGGTGPDDLKKILDFSMARIKELESKLNNHRQFISWLTVEGTQYGEEWEELAKSGLVVEVKPTPEFIDEWGDESEMYVLAWKAHEFEPVEVP